MTSSPQHDAAGRLVIRPHELGMSVRIHAERSGHDGRIGVIDEIAIYNTTAHGLDFTGWDMLVAFHNGRSHAYSAFDFDETEIVLSEPDRLRAEVEQLTRQLGEARGTARRIWRGETHPDGEPGWLTAEMSPRRAQETVRNGARRAVAGRGRGMTPGEGFNQ